MFSACSRAVIVAQAPSVTRAPMRAFWLLSSYSSRHASQTKSATGRLAANRVIGCAPQLGQNSEAATHPSVSTRAFCDALSNTAASSCRVRCAQGATAGAVGNASSPPPTYPLMPAEAGTQA